MQARDFMWPGRLYVRTLRGRRELFYLEGNGDDWCRTLAEEDEDGEFRCRTSGRSLECAEGPEGFTGSGDKLTIRLATDADVTEIIQKWRPHGPEYLWSGRSICDLIDNEWREEPVWRYLAQCEKTRLQRLVLAEQGVSADVLEDLRRSQIVGEGIWAAEHGGMVEACPYLDLGDGSRDREWWLVGFYPLPSREPLTEEDRATMAKNIKAHLAGRSART